MSKLDTLDAIRLRELLETHAQAARDGQDGGRALRAAERALHDFVLDVADKARRQGHDEGRAMRDYLGNLLGGNGR